MPCHFPIIQLMKDRFKWEYLMSSSIWHLRTLLLRLLIIQRFGYKVSHFTMDIKNVRMFCMVIEFLRLYMKEIIPNVGKKSLGAKIYIVV